MSAAVQEDGLVARLGQAGSPVVDMIEINERTRSGKAIAMSCAVMPLVTSDVASARRSSQRQNAEGLDRSFFSTSIDLASTSFISGFSRGRRRWQGRRA